jgi:tripartite-type tricarboxylate transporter receptor subunit TctC
MHANPLIAAAGIALAIALPGSAPAQTFPSKPLRIIVPFPPGGAADVTARVLGEHMTKSLGQPILIENRPGAGAVIGYETGARAPGDGYTMLVVFPSFVINAFVRSGLQYQPFRDFKAVGQTISVPMAISVHPSVPAKSLKELIALARTRPGELGYGTPGAGTTHHFVGEMLAVAAKVKFNHVPFSGGAPSVTATAGGHVPLLISNVSEIAPIAKLGKLRTLVVTTAERAETMPEVPSYSEAGFPQLAITNWAGMMVPAATPQAIIARLNTEMVSGLRNASIQDKLKVLGMFTTPGTPEQFDALLKSESARYAKAVQDAGIKLD